MRPIARDHLQTLVDREIHTVSGRPNTILALDGTHVIVATSRSPNGRRVPIEWVQQAMDVLARDGEVTVDVETIGYRSAFIGAVLSTLPGAVVRRTSPPRIRIENPWSPAERPARIEPPTLRPEIFDATMRGLETGLTVGDVSTFDFESCSTGAGARDVLKDPRLSIFDAFPVRDGDHIVGVLERGSVPRASKVRSVMRRLDDSLLVSAHDPLSSLVTVLSSNPYRMVVDRARIVGIVTRSDVHKLPMRLLVFALVTHLELLMAEVITRAMPDDRWVDRLSAKRRERFEGKRGELRSTNFDPPWIELTDFCDKRDLMLVVLDDLDIGRGRARKELSRIESLRNKVAHAAGFAADEAEFGVFVETFRCTEGWIGRLSSTLT